MRGVPVRLRVLLLLPIVVLAGCRSTAGGGGATTTGPPPTAATTVTGVAPTSTTLVTGFEVPAVIDLPYVQRVLKTIYHLDGEATRHIYAKKVPDAELYERLDAIFADPRLATAKRVLGENAADDFRRFAQPPGDAEVRAVDIIQATKTCIVVWADLDYGPQYRESQSPEPQAVIHLEHAEVARFNPTGWGITVAGAPSPGQNLKVCA